MYLPADEAEAEKEVAGDYESWDLTERQLCDIELLLNGAFSPLEGFLNKADYDAVVKTMRLASGVLWPIPITLDVTEEFAKDISPGDNIALRDARGVSFLLRSRSRMSGHRIWMRRPRASTAAAMTSHPGGQLPEKYRTHPVYVGGTPEGHRKTDPVRLQAFARRAGRSARPFSRSWAGARSSRSRRAIRCTGRTRN